MKEAYYYRQTNDNKVQCNLCPHNCIIHPEKRGTCGVRKNIDGKLFSENYGHVSAIHLDPIEKKPIYHFHPGSMILSVGSVGCNLKCQFCQNWQISQSCVSDADYMNIVSIDDIINKAVSIDNNIGIAYTYNEPIIWYEFMIDMAKKARENNLKNVIVSNGYINTDPLEELLPYIDAINIDFKSFNNTFYKKHTSSSFEPVKSTLKSVARSSTFLEITNLVIPTLNDDEQEFTAMINWISEELGQETVLHISRYFPTYKMNIPSTPEITLKKFHEIASKKLQYVYVGNIAGNRMQSTTCPQCGSTAIIRNHYITDTSGINQNGQCISCGNQITRND